jgi:hypothetical protein
MDDLSGSGDHDVDAFVDANLTSFAAWDVAVYLDHTEDVSSCVEDLVGRLGRKEYEVVPVLLGLVERGIAVRSTEPDGVVRYALSPDPAIRLTVARFVELAKVREVRLEFVRRVLARMSHG